MRPLLAAVIFSCGAFAQDRPPELYVSREYVRLQWTALEDRPVFDQPNGTQVIDRLRTNDRVQTILGETHSKPQVVIATRDHSQPSAFSRHVARITRGDTFYLLHTLADGLWRVWFNGEIIDIFSAWTPGDPVPETTWWAQIVTPRGVTGWVQGNDWRRGGDSNPR